MTIFGKIFLTIFHKAAADKFVLLTSKAFSSSFKLYSERSLKTIGLFSFDSKSLIQILKALISSNNLFVC